HLETEKVDSQELEDLRQEQSKYDRATNLIEQFATESDQPADKNVSAKEARDQILGLREKLDKIYAEIELLQKQKQLLEPWGDFSWRYIEKLEEQGVKFRFYQTDKKTYQSTDLSKVPHEIINQQKGFYYVMVMEKGETHELPFDLLNPPRVTSAEITEKLREKEQHRLNLIHQIVSFKGYIPAFAGQKEILQEKIDYLETQRSYKQYAEGKVLHLFGWFPIEIEKKVTSYLDEYKIAYQVEEPQKGDKIPVILKNDNYSKNFESITKIFQLPNYYELDLTPMIAVFYPIFFAYCLGDAGYGLILLTLTIIGRYTFLKGNKLVFNMGVILGIVSMVLGIVKSGTVLGIPIIENQDIPLFNYLSQFILIPDDQDYIFNAFNVALMLGVFQIIVGIVIAIVRKIKYNTVWHALGSLGKLFLVVGLIIIFLGSMQGVAALAIYVPAAEIMSYIGLGLVLFFHDPDIPIAQRLGGGILPLYNIATGLLGDTLSYIRLFAMGVASSVLGLVVNQIGSQIISAGGVYIVFGVLLLLVGHSLNLFLATLGSFVHPLRLTFVEFYNNAEFQGGGVPYQPFRKKVITENK
ncbi:MAG: V-type ATP synthase subunit I, partial [Cyclobacteriaceae bacterium]